MLLDDADLEHLTRQALDTAAYEALNLFGAVSLDEVDRVLSQRIAQLQTLLREQAETERTRRDLAAGIAVLDRVRQDFRDAGGYHGDASPHSSPAPRE